MTLEGKVAFIARVGRGQARSHALRLADEGTHIMGIDNCADIPSTTTRWLPWKTRCRWTCSS
jgi:hypothetical protein